MSWTEGQAGAVFALSGRLIGLDLFGHADTMRELLPKIVRSYALDAVEERGDAEREIPVSTVEDFITEVAGARVETFAALGLGRDLRLSSPGLTGGGLAWDERLIHLSAFRTAGDGTRSQDPGPRRRGLGQLLRASLHRWRSVEGGGALSMHGGCPRAASSP